MSAVSLKQVTKRYGRTVALCDFALSTELGECLGLIGPNGAGKSTSLRIMLGLVRPTFGAAALFGEDPWRRPQVRQSVGYLPEGTALYPELTARQTIRYSAQLYGLEPSNLEIDELLERVELAGSSEFKVRHLSKGMVRRLALACALAHDPQLLVLDEPFSGLDPQGVQDLQRLLRQYRAEKTIVLSSHNLGAVEALCDRLAILDQGRLVALDRLERLLRSGTMRAQMELSAVPPELLGEMESVSSVEAVEPSRNGTNMVVHLKVKDLEARSQLARQVMEAGAELYELRWERPSLDELFERLTGEARHNGDQGRAHGPHA